MSTWTELVTKLHSWAHKNDGYNLVLNGPASEADLSALADELGITLPAEFIDFYRHHDGFGVQHTSDPTTIHWSFVPIAQIPELLIAGRDWFQETHPELAASFFPFIDWNCGDYTGIIVSPDGQCSPGLYTFEHEAFEFDDSQSPEDFMQQRDDSIADHLSID